MTKDVQRRLPRYAPEPVSDIVWWTPELGAASLLVGLGVTVAWPISLLATFPLARAVFGEWGFLAAAAQARRQHATGAPELEGPARVVHATAVRLNVEQAELPAGEDGPR